MKNLDLPIAKYDSIKAQFDSWMQYQVNDRVARMNHYMDCVDDYSFGGLCGSVSYQAQKSFEQLVDLVKEQEENDGYITRTYYDIILVNKVDGTRFTYIANTRFGRAFYKDGKYVSLSKKLSTFEKKGFEAHELKHTIKFQLAAKFTSKFKPVFRSMEVETEETVIDSTTKNLNFDKYENLNGWHDHIYYVADSSCIKR